MSYRNIHLCQDYKLVIADEVFKLKTLWLQVYIVFERLSEKKKTKLAI